MMFICFLFPKDKFTFSFTLHTFTASIGSILLLFILHTIYQLLFLFTVHKHNLSLLIITHITSLFTLCLVRKEDVAGRMQFCLYACRPSHQFCLTHIGLHRTVGLLINFYGKFQLPCNLYSGYIFHLKK